MGLQLHLSSPADIAVNLQLVESGVAVHILRYDYSFEEDRIPQLDELQFDLRLPETFSKMEVFSPGEPPKIELKGSNGMHSILLKNLPLYSILLLKE